MQLTDILTVSTAERHVELLKEQEALTASVADIKGKAATARADFDKMAKEQQNAKVRLSDQVKELESEKAKIENENSAKLRINKAVSDEYDKLRAEMLAKVAGEEKAASQGLEKLISQVKTAQDELLALAEKKKQFIASLG